MKLVTMIFKNTDGSIIEKEIEERFVSTYKSMGWKLKDEKKELNSFKNTFESSKELDK